MGLSRHEPLNPRPTRAYAAGMGENSEYYAGWGTLMLINAALARSLRRSGFTWFLLSLLLGPVATLLLALLGPREGA